MKNLIAKKGLLQILLETGALLSVLAAVLCVVIQSTNISLLNAGLPMALDCWIFMLLIPVLFLQAAMMFFVIVRLRQRSTLLILSFIATLLALLNAGAHFEQVQVLSKVVRGLWNLSESGYAAVLQAYRVPRAIYISSIMETGIWFVNRGK